MLSEANRLLCWSIVPPHDIDRLEEQTTWARDICTDLWAKHSITSTSGWHIVEGHDRETDQPVLRAITTDLSNAMRLAPRALEHLEIVRISSVEQHWGRIMLNWDSRVPPDLENFDNTLEMYRLDTGVIVRRLRSPYKGGLQPKLAITAPTLPLWQNTRLKIVRNP